MLKLKRAWAKDLEENTVDFFHAKDHWNRRYKPYHGLSMAKRKALLDRLVGHVHKFATLGLSVSVDIEEYKTITTNSFRARWGAAYSFAVQMLFVLLHEHLIDRKRTHETVNVLIEDGHANANQMLDILKAMKKKMDSRITIGSYGLGGKPNNPILQAADMLAYGCCQYVANGQSAMYKKLAWYPRPRFRRLACDSELIDRIKQDINANIEREMELKLQRHLTPR